MTRRISSLLAAAAATVVLCGGSRVLADTTPPQPASAQPSLPQPMPSAGDVLKTMGGPDTGLEPRRKTPQHHRSARRRSIHRQAASVRRPALAGVELAGPLPRPPQPPHFTTPTPAYPLEAITAAFTTPLPPVVCHPAAVDPELPNPRLYKQRGLVCASDNP